MSVQPTATTSYHLVGQISSIQRTLGTVTVTVDTSQCFIRTVSEATVRDLLHSQFASALAGTPLSQRSPAGVEIDRGGIAVKLRLKISVPNFFDPDLNIDMVVGLTAVNHTPVLSFRRFSVDVHWPWWVTGITLGVTEFIDGIIESSIERRVKPLILQKLKEQIDSLLRLVPQNYRLQSISTEADQIRVTVCPAS